MVKKLIGSVGLTATDTGFDLTTKGDTHGYSTTNARIPIGSNDQVLTADSTTALGLKWATVSGSDTPWTEVHDFDVWYYDMQIQSKPSDPSADNARFYVKEIDSDNDGLFCIIRKNGAFEETQIA